MENKERDPALLMSSLCCSNEGTILYLDFHRKLPVDWAIGLLLQLEKQYLIHPKNSVSKGLEGHRGFQ